MINPPLKDVTVLDAGRGMSAALVAKMLAEAGADVTRLSIYDEIFEKIYPAFSLWHSKARKKSEAVDLNMPDGSQPDIIIMGGEDHPDLPPLPSADSVLAEHPNTIVLYISSKPAGLDGCEMPAHELLAQVRSGLSNEISSERPMYLAFPAASYGAALVGSIALMAALCEREKSGVGQIVRTSLVQGALAWLGPLWLQTRTSTGALDMIVPKGARHTIFRCADGVFIHFALGVPNAVKNLDAILGNTEPHRGLDARGLPTGKDSANYFGDIDLIQSHVGKWQSEALMEELRKCGIPVEKVMAPGECWLEPQVIANQIIVTDVSGRRYVGSTIKGF